MLTKIEKLKRDIQTLRDSMHLDAEELLRATSPEDQQAIREHLQWCANELATLRGMFGDA
jgi:hypothetical protein